MSANLTGLYPGGFNARKYDRFEPATPPELAFADALAAFGLIVDGPIIPGEITRTAMADQKRGNKRNGWYLFFGADPSTNIAAGVYGDWRQPDHRQYWSSKSEKDMTAAEADAYRLSIMAMQQKAETERAARQDEAASEAAGILAKAPLAASHEYLARKGVKPYGLYTQDNALLVPLRNAQGDIRSLQRIYPNGDKRFLAGGQTKGCFHLIGSTLTEPTYLVEGYATGATIHDVTGKSVIVAFNSGNLAPVLDAIRASNPQKIIIAADNDRNTEGNPGITAANKAAEGYLGVSVTFPTFQGSEGSDFNDLAMSEGVGAVREQLIGGTASPLGFPIRWANTTEYKEPAPLDYVIDDYLVAGTTSMVFGGPGICKSFLVQDMGMSVATGKDWHGREVHQGLVFYVCGEGHQDLPNRIHAWKGAYGYTKDDHFPFYHSEHEINLRDPAMVKALVDIIKTELAAHLPRLIIIDTLSTNFGGGDENTGDMTDFINHMNGLARDTDAHVLIVHHTGKDKEKGARGNSSSHGNVFTYMPVDEKDGLTRLSMQKQKGGPQMKPLGFEMELVDLGEAADRRGRMKQITSLVPHLKLDANAGENAAAQLIDNERKKRGGMLQQITQRTLKRLLADATNNPPTIDQKTLYEALKSAGIPEKKTTEYKNYAETEGLIEQNGFREFLLVKSAIESCR